MAKKTPSRKGLTQAERTVSAALRNMANRAERLRAARLALERELVPAQIAAAKAERELEKLDHALYAFRRFRP